jgi:hypothetical protein
MTCIIRPFNVGEKMQIAKLKGQPTLRDLQYIYTVDDVYQLVSLVIHIVKLSHPTKVYLHSCLDYE